MFMDKLEVGAMLALLILVFTWRLWPRRTEWQKDDAVLSLVMSEARVAMTVEPLLGRFYRPILAAASFEQAVATSVASRLAGRGVSARKLEKVCLECYGDNEFREHGWPVGACLRKDVAAVLERDPACEAHIDVILYFKGFLALAAHRVARWAWEKDRRGLALWLQSRTSEVAAVDIHPAATISCGVMFDHATGIVVGETASIGDGCTLLHGVTLGATGKDKGDRHPKVGKYVLIGANSSLLGNIRVGDGAKVGSGAVVLRHVPAGATAVGAPARIVGRAKEARPAEEVDNGLLRVETRKSCGDFQCVWREISKHAPSDQRAIGFLAFSAALSEHGVPDAEIGDLFFQLDRDQDGLVGIDDLGERFTASADKYLPPTCEKAQLSNVICEAIAANSSDPKWAACSKGKAAAMPPKKLNKSPSQMENAAAASP